MQYELNEYHRNLTDQELLDDIKRVAKLIAPDSLSQEKYKEHGRYGVTTIHRRFGTWMRALELCNLNTSVMQKAASSVKHYNHFVDTDELIDDIRRVAEYLNKSAISSSEYSKHGKYSRDVCFKRFSTWENALQSAGLASYTFVPGHKLDNAVLLEDIERMWIKLGRQPTATDVKNGLSTFSLHAYTSHFGGWRNALQAFILWVNDKTENDYENAIQMHNQVKNEKKSRKVTINVDQSENDCSERKTTRDINLRLRFQVMQRDHFVCQICGASPAKDPSVELHIDHIKPWSKGGLTTIDNLQTLCSKCNLGKSDLYDEN